MNKPLAQLSPLHHRSAMHIKVSIANTSQFNFFIRFKKIAGAIQNLIMNAYRAYVEKMINRPKEWVDIPRPKRPKQLPNVFSEDEDKGSTRPRIIENHGDLPAPFIKGSPENEKSFG